MQHSVTKSASLPQQSFDMSAPQFASMAVDASHQSGMAHHKNCNLTRCALFCTLFHLNTRIYGITDYGVSRPGIQN